MSKSSHFVAILKLHCSATQCSVQKGLGKVGLRTYQMLKKKLLTQANNDKPQNDRINLYLSIYSNIPKFRSPLVVGKSGPIYLFLYSQNVVLFM